MTKNNPASNKVAQTAIIMMILALSAKVVGLYREILFAAIYGTDSSAQAYLAASQIPLNFFDIALGTAVSSTFIPVFNEYLELKDKDYAFDFANRFFNLIIVITGILSVLGIIFATPVVALIAGGYAPETKVLTVKLIRIMFPTMIASGLAYSLVGLLQSLGEFKIPAALSLVANGIIVLYLHLFGDKLGVTGLSVAMLVGWAMQIIIQIPSLKKYGYRFRFNFNFKCEGIKRVAILAVPILVSSWVQPINNLVNMSLSSYLNGGSGANAINYANKIYIILAGVITFAISNLIFPSMSKFLALGKKEEYAKIINKALRVVVSLIMPIMTGFLLLSTPIIRLAYERGAFTSADTYLTSTALFFYSMGMLGYAATEIMNKGFYAMQDGKTPMHVSMIGISINVALSFLFVRGLDLGVAGLATAASVAANVIAVLLVLKLNKKIPDVINKSFGIHFIKTLVSCVVMAVCVFAVKGLFNPDGGTLVYNFISVLVPTVVGAVVYAVVGLILKIDEIKMCFDMIVNTGKKLIHR